MRLRSNTGGFDLVSIVANEPLHVGAVVREKKSPTVARLVIDVSEGEPPVIRGLGIRVVPPGGAPPEGCKTYQPPPTSSNGTADPKDVAFEDAILTALYASISGPACQHRDWGRFRSLFAPGARLIPTGMNAAGQAIARVETPDEYAAAAKTGLEENGFFEHPDRAHRAGVSQHHARLQHLRITAHGGRREAVRPRHQQHSAAQ
jgi:hypothetical protein